MRRRLAAALIGLLLAFAAAELLLRVTGLAAPPPVKVSLIDAERDVLRFNCYPSNPHGRLQPLPDDLDPADWTALELTEPPRAISWDEVRARPFCAEYRYGLPGVRGPEVALRPRPGVLRVVGCGDSFAFGEGVPFQETLFARLDAELGPDVEVLNCAQSGSDLDLGVRTLEWAVPQFGAQRAVLVLTLNDVRGPRTAGPVDLINVRPGLHPRLEWSAVARLVERIVRTAGVTSGTIEAYRSAYDSDENGVALRSAVRKLERAAQVPGCRTVVVIYPLLHALDGDYPFRDAHATLVRLAADAGLPALDLLSAFEGRDPTTLHVHPIDHHPNGLAHEIAADALVEWLRREQPDFLAR